jgi:glycosyltransferase involved in cell wall biosynthesis
MFIKFIAISQALADIWLSRGVPENKIMALHDAVSLNNHSHVPDFKSIREKLNLLQDKKIILYAGSLYPDRGIETILRLAKSFPKALFVILGGPEDRKVYYEQKSADLDIHNIEFFGYIPHHDVTNYLVAADILLMIWSKQVKTINFCSPLKMFEYMASGRIIVGHAFPTIKEVLTDGKTAFLADPDSYGDLRNKLDKALKQEYPNPMAEEARRLALNKYTWQVRAKTILNSIQSL